MDGKNYIVGPLHKISFGSQFQRVKKFNDLSYQNISYIRYLLTKLMLKFVFPKKTTKIDVILTVDLTDT